MPNCSIPFLSASSTKPAVIGVVHLPPLPGSPAYSPPWQATITRALQDASTLIQEGVAGLLIENYGDVPFYPQQVPPITISCMSAIAQSIRQRWPQIPLGINVLRNDAIAALAVACAGDCQFIRVYVWNGVRVTDQGLIPGCAAEVSRLRRFWDAEHVQIWADVQVKHSSPLIPQTLEEALEEVWTRSPANAVIITGTSTGKPVESSALPILAQHAERFPLVIGSGITPSFLETFSPLPCTALIVGTWFHRDGSIHHPVDHLRVRQLMACLH